MGVNSASLKEEEMDSGSINLRQLKIFSTIAKEGSFTRAAETLMITEGAVSQQVKSLERGLGVRLFDRRASKPIELTRSGFELVSICDEVFDRLEHGIVRLDALRRAEEFSVAFG